MGLDIYHFKVSLYPETEYDYLEVELFPKEAFEKYGFDKFLTKSPLLGADENCIRHHCCPINFHENSILV
jgi:hypothetical protein